MSSKFSPPSGSGSSDEPKPEGQDHKPVRLPDSELRKSLWIIVVSWGVFGSAWMAAVMGAPFAAFARDLGAGTFLFGILSSLRFIAVVAQIPGAYLVERMGNRKKFFFLTHIPSRLMWLVIAAIPWIFPEQFSALRLGGFMVFFLVFRLLDASGGVAWVPWVADIVPERVRARFLGQRQRLATFTAMLAAALSGWLLDRQAEGQFYMYTIIFAVAAIVGLVDILMYWRVPNIAPLKEETLRIWEIIGRPLRNRRFRMFLLYAASNSVSGSVMGTFIWLYAFDVMEYSKFTSNIYLVVIASFATIFTARAGGVLADRFGNRAVLRLSSGLIVLSPLLWALAPSETYVLPFIAAIIGGGCGGINMTLGMNLMFAMTPRASRPAYVAIASLATGLAGFVAPILAGAVTQALSGVNLSLFGLWEFGNLHLLLIAVSLYRIGHTIWLVPRLPEKRDISSRAMIKELVSGRRKR